MVNSGSSKTRVRKNKGLLRGKPHCYPASFGEELARQEIENHSAEGDTILDPYMGSATTLIQARLTGRRAMGIDIDPVAHLIGKVLTSAYSAESLLELQDWVIQRVACLETPAITEELTRTPWLPGETRHIGQHTATIPDNPKLDYWFSPIQSAILAALTGWVTDSPPTTKDVLRLAISAAIVRKWPNTISRAKDVDHSRPHKVDRPHETIGDQLRVFRLSFRKVIAYLKRLNELAPVDDAGRAVIIQDSSATFLKTLPESSIDYVLSSPPYFDAIDYPRAHKFSQWWLWPEQALLRRDYVGLKPGGQPDVDVLNRWRDGLPQKVVDEIAPIEKTSKALAMRFYRYVEDLDTMAGELARVVKPHGVATFVVGNNVIKGNQAPVVEVVTAVFQHHGFAGVTVQGREMEASKRRYPYGITGFKGLMQKEYIIRATR